MVICVAVISGALFTGDSVKYSLRMLTESRLGKIRYAIDYGDRTFRDKLALKIGNKLNTNVSAVLHSEGMGINNEQQLRINNLTVYGIDSTFMDFWPTESITPNEDEVFISQNTATKLNIKVGNDIFQFIDFILSRIFQFV